MAYQFGEFKTKLAEVEEWFKGECSAIRTGRASIALLDDVRADVYGSKMPLNQVASVNVEDARTIRIAPWDHANTAPVEKAIRDANLGVSVVGDDKGLRVVFPEMTGESREKYAKLLGKKLEEARVSVRSAREEVWGDIQKQEKDGDMSEDEKFRGKEEMEKLVKDANEKLEALAKRKEEEILG